MRLALGAAEACACGNAQIENLLPRLERESLVNHARIPMHPDPPEGRNQLLEQFQFLGGDLGARTMGQLGHVATEVRQARHEAMLDRIGAAPITMGMGLLSPWPPCSAESNRHDHIELALNQIARQGTKPVHLSVRKPGLSDEVLAIDVSHLVQGVPERRGDCIGRGL